MSTVHRIERGGLEPSVDSLERIVEAAGVRLRVEPIGDSSGSAVGLARAVQQLVDDLAAYEPIVRRAADHRDSLTNVRPPGAPANASSVSSIRP